MTRTLARTCAALAAVICLALPAAASADHSLLDLVSPGPHAIDPDEDDNNFRAMSDDGSRIYFQSGEAHVPEDDDGGSWDVYVRSGDRTTLLTPDTEFSAEFDHVSSDGSRLTFTTEEPLTSDDEDTKADVYQQQGDTVTLLSGGAGGAVADNAFFAAASDDGSRVYFWTFEPIAGGTADSDAKADIYEGGDPPALVSEPAPGGEGTSSDVSTVVGSTPDGSHLYVQTSAALDPADDDTPYSDVYEIAGAGTTLISRREQTGNGDAHARFMAVSSDGARVAYRTNEAIDPSDTDGDGSDSVPAARGEEDIWLWENGGSTLQSIGSGARASSGTHDVAFGQANADLTQFVFGTSEQLADDDGAAPTLDLYLRTPASDETELLTAGDAGGGGVYFLGATPSLSRVLFETPDALSSEDDDGDGWDIYAADPGGFTLVSTSASDPHDPQAEFDYGDISDDGSRVFFRAYGAGSEPGEGSLDPRDTDAEDDVYERHPGGTTFLSAGGNEDLEAWFYEASSDGRTAMFDTQENLVAADDDEQGYYDIYAARAPAPSGGDGGGGGGSSSSTGGGGDTGGGNTGGGGTTVVPDTQPPGVTTSVARSQRVSRGLTIGVTPTETGTLNAGATVNVPGAAKVYRFKSVTRAVQAAQKVTIKLKLAKKALKKVLGALKRGKKLKAKVTLTITDGAGNRTPKTLSIKLKR